MAILVALLFISLKIIFYGRTSTYDEFLRLKTVVQGGKTTTYIYDANGNIATKTSGDAVTTYGYNDANMVISMATSTDDLGNVTNFVYTYYTDGNQRTKADSVNNVTTTYTYDAVQLKSEVKTGAVNQTDLYTYDASGNRIQKVEQRSGTANKTITSTYNNMNQLVETYDNATDNTDYYYYDELGNLMSDGKGQYQYDHCGRLGYSIVNGKSNSYKYYIDRLRKSKTVNNVATYFIWLDGNMVYEFIGNDSNTYTYGHRLLYSEDYKYVLNAHGDVVALIGTTNEVAKRYEYDSYGNEINIAPTDTNPFRYCGEYYDRETGQIYLRARYYQPIVGRFTQRDTHWNIANMIYGDDPRTKEYEDYLGLNDYTVKLVDYAAIRQSGNLYGYCLNNPIFFVDSFGNAVRGYGLSASAALYLGYEGQVLWVTDDKGNFALMTVNGGVNSCGFSMSGVLFSFPDMPDLYALQGSGWGVSVGINGIGGGILIAGKYTGTILSVGLGAEADPFLTADITYTYLTPIHGNICDISNFFKSIINFFLPESLEI